LQKIIDLSNLLSPGLFFVGRAAQGAAMIVWSMEFGDRRKTPVQGHKNDVQEFKGSKFNVKTSGRAEARLSI
jgi:hypothetical protein